MELTGPPEKLQAVDEAQSDQSGRRTPAKDRTRPTSKARTKPQLELLRLLGLSSFGQAGLILVLEIVVAWAALAIAVALVSDDLPMTTLWQRLQVLISSRPTTVVFLLAIAAAIVVPTFLWFHVVFVWVLVLWRLRRAPQARRAADGSRPRVDPTVPTGPPE